MNTYIYLSESPKFDNERYLNNRLTFNIKLETDDKVWFVNKERERERERKCLKAMAMTK